MATELQRALRPTLLLPLLLASLTFALYLNTFNNEITNWDDNRYITENELIRDLSGSGIWRMFSQFHFSDYSPITLLSYAVDYAFWRLKPVGYHLTNTLLHLVNTVLLFYLMRQFRQSNLVAFLTSLFFAAHPIQVESVAWLSQRKNLLAMAFFLLTFIFHVKSRREKNSRAASALALSFYLLAVLSKPVVVGAPIILAAYDRLFSQLPWREILRRNALYFLIGGLAAIVGFASQYASGGVKSFPGGSVLRTSFLMLRVLWDYVLSLLLPNSLDNLYIYGVDGIRHDPGVLFGAAIVILAIVLAWRQPLGRPYCAFAVLWFAVLILPVANIVPMAVQRADRYLYFPGIAVFFLAGLAIEKIWRKSNSLPAALITKTALTAGLIAILSSNAALTIARNRVWRNSRTLWEDHLKKNPQSSRGYLNLAGYYRERNRQDQAVPLYHKALSNDPGSTKAYYALAAMASESGRLDEAIVLYQQAIYLIPGDKDLYNNLGFTYHRKGLYKDAIAAYQEALRLDRRSLKAWTNMGYAYLQSGDKQRARECFDAALALNPRDIDGLRGRELALQSLADHVPGNRDKKNEK